MIYDSLLEKSDLTALANPKFFILQKKFFEIEIRKTNGIKISKDVYSIPLNGSPDFPDEPNSMRHSLRDYISGNIFRSFAKLSNELNREIIKLEGSNSKNSLKDMLLNQLGILGSNIEKIEAPDEYIEFIHLQFIEGIQQIEESFYTQKQKSQLDWEIRYQDIDSENGRIKLKEFFDELVAKNLLNGKTKFQSFKKFFRGKQPGTKIIWSGNKNDLVTLIKILQGSRTTSVLNPWAACKNCFVFSKEDISFKNIENEKGTKSNKRKALIEGVVKILE